MGTYIIAEIGSTHDGSLGNALEMASVFANIIQERGAIKFQCHVGQKVSGPHPSGNVMRMETRQSYYDRTNFTREQYLWLAERAHQLGVDFIVSPFSVEAVELLSESGSDPYEYVDAWKIASGEVTNRALLEAVKATGKPVYLSSGMSTTPELCAAIDLLWEPLKCLLHCTSEYPCSPERVGLNVIEQWVRWRDSGLQPGSEQFLHRGHAVGLSDHTMGTAASLAAITLGATVIERHVCLSRRQYGSDAAHSLTPEEFARFVGEVRELDRMLASPVDKDALVKTPEIQRMREVFLCR